MNNLELSRGGMAIRVYFPRQSVCMRPKRGKRAALPCVRHSRQDHPGGLMSLAFNARGGTSPFHAHKQTKPSSFSTLVGEGENSNHAVETYHNLSRIGAWLADYQLNTQLNPRILWKRAGNTLGASRLCSKKNCRRMVICNPKPKKQTHTPA